MSLRKYETLLLLSPELTDEEREETLATFTGIIERDGGKILTIDKWGMRDLAYPVRKLTRGYYVRYEYLGGNALVQELERIIRITENVFKFVTVKLEHEHVEEEEVA